MTCFAASSKSTVDLGTQVPVQLAQRAFDRDRLARHGDFHAGGDGHGLFTNSRHGCNLLQPFALAKAYHSSHSTSPPRFRCRASRSLITPRLVLMIEIPRPLSTGRKPIGAAIDAAARLADALDVADHALAVGAVFQFNAQLRPRARPSTSSQSQM